MAGEADNELLWSSRTATKLSKMFPFELLARPPRVDIDSHETLLITEKIH
jgi:hypothetical protein